jgi:hypothetical protein
MSNKNVHINMGQRGNGPAVEYDAQITGSYRDYIGATWYTIRYIDDNGIEREGEVRADFVQQQ